MERLDRLEHRDKGDAGSFASEHAPDPALPVARLRGLVVAPQPFFTSRGTPFSVYYRTLVGAELGAKIDLLTYGEGLDVDLPLVEIIRTPRFGFLGPTKIGPSFKKVLLDLFLFLRAFGLLVTRKYDFVHAHEESVFFMRWLKPLFGFKLVYDMHSRLSEQLQNYEFSKSRLLRRLFERLEESCLRASDAVITICPELEQYALAHMPEPGRHFLIENSIFEPVRVRAPQEVRHPAGREISLPQDRRIVAYAGTFEAYQGLAILLKAFVEVHEHCPDAFLLLVGGNQKQVETCRRLAQDLGVADHCLFTGQVSQALAQRYLTRAAVLVSPRTSGTNTPLKIYEQLASGIPFVATRVLSHTQILDDRVCFLVDPEPASVAAGLRTALTDEAARRRVVAAARQLYDSAYSRTVYEAKMRQLLNAIS
jgi:glycosyltransferase involved in cell wall biosynthesis